MSSTSNKERDNPETLNLSPETARKLFDNGGVLVILNLPVGSVFGIDMKVFAVGEKFRGIKMIPPGLHFIYYSAVSSDGTVAPRTGFFHYFHKREIVLKKWNKEEEELSMEHVPEDEVQRIRSNLQDLDPYLGTYPYKGLKNWNRLTCNISESLLRKLQPVSGVISSVTPLVPLAFPPIKQEDKQLEEAGPSKRSHLSLEERLLPDMKQVPGTEIRFTKIPELKYPAGSVAAEITQHSMDSTYMFEQLLSSYDNEEDVLGELQMALVCFLVGHVYDSFEHWKKLVEILCSVDSGLDKHVNFFKTFLTLLHFQIKEIPTDFFTDITHDDNFIIHTLTIFFEIAKNSSDRNFRAFVENFEKNLTKTYKWDFQNVPDDELPVVVET